MAFGKSFQLVLHLALITGGLYCELTTVTASSVADASAHNLFANHRPRFKIPKGNLSYYRRPHWEILYFMKYGNFPFYGTSSSYLNRTQFINKMRAIKDMFDRQTTEEESGDGNIANNNTEDQNERSRLAVIVPMSQEKQTQVGNNQGYYPNSLLDPQDMEDNIRSIKRLSSKKNVDVPLLRQRLAQGHNTDYRSGGPLLLEIEGGQDGFSDEMTIERKVGRKFQTQGWK